MSHPPLVPVLTPEQLVALARARYSAKAYDPGKPVPAAALDALVELLRASPSSVNSQPWHFVVAGTPAARARIARATAGPYAYNAPKIADASHVVVLCARTDLPPAQVEAIVAQEAADGRYRDDAARAAGVKTKAGYIDPQRQSEHGLPRWIDKQTYLALGGLLLGAAALGLDATPMEGFDGPLLDAELGLTEKGLRSLVLVSLGTRAETDFNAALPKSRLPREAVVTVL